jgi:hypothetical protein
LYYTFLSKTNKEKTMIKKIGFAAALSALLLSGCGGGGSSDPKSIKDSKIVVILKNVSTGICESKEYRDLLSKELTGVLTEERSTSVQCSDYGKTNGRDCAIRYYTGSNRGNKACVVGAEGERSKKQNKQITTEKSVDLINFDFIDITFIQIAE